MCGRFALFLAADDLREELELNAVPVDFIPRYNVAPTQAVLAVADAAVRNASWMRWGLVPSWAKDLSIGSRMINARAETLAEKPSFRAAFARRRCLILANGFYEWQKSGKGPSQPYFISLREGRPFAFAGLWELWRSPEGEEVKSCTIITTTPNARIAEIHDRMPVILTGEKMWNWLVWNNPAQLGGLLAPYPAEEIQAAPVGRMVNDPNLDGPELIRDQI
jgi:putative SOS response-associated peptidase YedK